jgi:NAD(P)H-hydrate repair Nnr-like enzyme with NAD(P)H-hydrate dehydratase domain
MLPLSGVVAFAGSRHGSPFPVLPVVSAVLAAGGVVRVGCARGVDAAVRATAPNAVTLEAKNFPGVAAMQLAARTRAVVAGAHALVLFPPGSGVLGPGSTLALECALKASLPVWVAGRRAPSSAWSALNLAGVPGWFLGVPESLF